MREFATFLFAVFLTVAPLSQAQSQDAPWANWVKLETTSPEPDTFLEDGAPDGPAVIVASVSQLSELYGSALPKDLEGLFEIGLSVLWIDLDQLDETKLPDTGGLVASGRAETEHGTRAFLARLSGVTGNDRMIVYLTPVEDTQSQDVARYLHGDLPVVADGAAEVVR